MTQEEAYNVLYSMLAEETNKSKIDALTVAVKALVALQKAHENKEELIAFAEKEYHYLVVDAIKQYLRDIE